MTVNPGPSDTEVVCEFLPASKADGCLIEWRPAGQESFEELQVTVVPRSGADDRVSAHLQTLTAGETYQVFGFGIQNDVRLHTFPIAPEHGLVTIPSGML